MISPLQFTKNRIVVDTDVFSYAFRKDPIADYFTPYFVHKTLAISFMTVAELYYGAYKDGWGLNRITQLENAIKNYVVLPYDYLICQEWARVSSQRKIKGLPIGHADAWIAACALRHDCALATNNGQHFKDIKGLEVISPSLI